MAAATVSRSPTMSREYGARPGNEATERVPGEPDSSRQPRVAITDLDQHQLTSARSTIA